MPRKRTLLIAESVEAEMPRIMSRTLTSVDEAAAGAHAHESLDAVILDELVDVDREARHAHARAHHRHALALVGPRIAEHVAHIVEALGLLEEGLGDELGPQGVPGQEDALRLSAPWPRRYGCS